MTLRNLVELSNYLVTTKVLILIYKIITSKKYLSCLIIPLNTKVFKPLLKDSD